MPPKKRKRQCTQQAPAPCTPKKQKQEFVEPRDHDTKATQEQTNVVSQTPDWWIPFGSVVERHFGPREDGAAVDALLVKSKAPANHYDWNLRVKYLKRYGGYGGSFYLPRTVLLAGLHLIARASNAEPGPWRAPTIKREDIKDWDRRCRQIVDRITDLRTLNACGYFGKSALFLAIAYGATETCRALLARVPDVDLGLGLQSHEVEWTTISDEEFGPDPLSWALDLASKQIPHTDARVIGCAFREAESRVKANHKQVLLSAFKSPEIVDHLLGYMLPDHHRRAQALKILLQMKPPDSPSASSSATATASASE